MSAREKLVQSEKNHKKNDKNPWQDKKRVVLYYSQHVKSARHWTRNAKAFQTNKYQWFLMILIDQKKS